jgi:hypothetical protein
MVLRSVKTVKINPAPVNILDFGLQILDFLKISAAFVFIEHTQI